MQPEPVEPSAAADPLPTKTRSTFQASASPRLRKNFPPARNPKAATNEGTPPGMVVIPSGEFLAGMEADLGYKECSKYFFDCIKNSFSQ